MCHHADDLIREDWKQIEAAEEEEAEEETDENPSFATTERDVEVDLLEADDD